MRVKTYLRLAAYALLALVIGLAQWNSITAVQEVEPSQYSPDPDAVELEVTPDWRYFVVCGHGCTLFRTRNVKGTPPSIKPEEYRELRERTQSAQRLRLRDGLLELGFYLAILGYVFFGIRWLRPKLQGSNRRRCIAFETLAWMAGASLIFLPRAFGYGAGIWAPSELGDLNILGFYPGSVTYRHALLGIELPPIFLGLGPLFLVTTYVIPTSLFPNLLPALGDFGLWVIALLIYGAIGFVVGVLRNRMRHAQNGTFGRGSRGATQQVRMNASESVVE